MSTPRTDEGAPSTRSRCAAALLVALVALGSPAAARAACSPVPLSSLCKQPTDARNLVDIKAGYGFPGPIVSSRDAVTWKIPKLEATAAAHEDPLVKAILETFPGAKLVNVSVRDDEAAIPEIAPAPIEEDDE